MKYFKSFFCLILVCFIFSGCSLRFSSSIDDLISPLSPFGDNADIKNALDAYAQNGYSLKAPNSGSFITSYNFFDIDGDGADEAIAFYEPSDNLGTINMALIKKVDGEWRVINNNAGDGREVHSLEFSDINNDGQCELIVCWDVISNSSNHELSVYKVEQEDNSLQLVKIDDSITVNNYICVDLFSDKSKELLLFEILSGNSQSAKAQLYSYNDNHLGLLGETKLDSHINSYKNINVEYAEDGARVYADALGTDGSSMLTEIIYWSKSYSTIVSPFYNYSSGLTEDTKRHTTIYSLDINDDGLIEIPMDYKLDGLPDGVSAQDWQIYKSSVMMHSEYSICPENDGYIVFIPEDYIDYISVAYNEERRELTVLDSDSEDEIYSVMPVLKATYSEGDYPGYKKVFDMSGYCYLAKLGSNDDITITLDDLSSMIKPIN